MPFYFRKSVSAGPFRFNFSKGGVGVSVGVKGLRIGTGPRGHYVHAGRGGFYYRATIGRPSGRPEIQTPLMPEPQFRTDDSGLVQITSGSVMAMQDSAFADILSEINIKSRQPRLSVMLGLVSALVCAALITNFGPVLLPSLLFVAAAAGFGAWLDSYKRAVVLFYDEDALASFRQICEAFDGLGTCAGKWHVRAAKPVYDLTTWKRQAGASTLVERKPAVLAYKLPSVIKSNITPPFFQIGSRLIYFLPDVVLVQDGSLFGAVSYATLSLKSQQSNFVEDGTVPHDTEILYHTWQHPNKGGGPDRRFRDNRQIPVCRYELMHITSDSGVNELFEFSRFGQVAPFVRSIGTVPKGGNMGVPRLGSNASENGNASQDEGGWRSEKWLGAMLWVVGLISAGFILFGLTRLDMRGTPTSAPTVQEPASRAMFVTTRRLNCRTSPTVRATVARTFRRGERVFVIDEQNGWSKIAVGSVECWSASNALSATDRPSGRPGRRQQSTRREADAPSASNVAETAQPDLISPTENPTTSAPRDRLPPATNSGSPEARYSRKTVTARKPAPPSSPRTAALPPSRAALRCQLRT